MMMSESVIDRLKYLRDFMGNFRLTAMSEGRNIGNNEAVEIIISWEQLILLIALLDEITDGKKVTQINEGD